MSDELRDFLDDLEEIVFELEKDENTRDFNPIERLRMMIVDLSDERQKTTDGYPVNRHSRVYSYSKSSSDGVPSIGDVRLEHGRYCSWHGPKEPFFHKRENVVEYIRSIGQIPIDDKVQNNPNR